METQTRSPRTAPRTLRDLRDRSGLTIQQILDRMREVEPDVPRFRPGLIHLEKRGTRSTHLVRALAHAYGITREEAEEAAEESRRRYYQNRGNSLDRAVTNLVT